MQGIRRRLGVAPKRKAPATVDRLEAMVAATDPATLKGVRDRAILLFGFASACRRSELAAFEVEDLEHTERGLLVTVRRGKTDQEGSGHQRAVLRGRRADLCPVRAVEQWRAAALVDSGRLFRSVDRYGGVGGSLGPRAVGAIVKRAAESAGLDPAAFGGHSLRAGFVTSASANGAGAERIMDHTGHSSAAMVRVYTRRADAFADHAAEGLL